MCPSRSHANADNAKASVVAPVTTSSQVAFEVGRSVAKSSIAASYPLTPSAATDVLEGPLTQAKSMPVQCLVRTGGPRMQENSDNQIVLFVRDESTSAAAGSHGIRSASRATQRIRTNVSASVVNETAPQASTIIAPATILCRVAFDTGPPPVTFARSA